MKAYILTDPQGQIKDRDQLDLYDGVLALNYEVVLIKEIDIYSKKVIITKDDFFGGHVQLCQWIWKQMGVEDPKIPDYPDELEEFFLRKIKKTTLGNFRKILRENENFGKSYFIKPVKTKLFTGFVCVVEQDLSKLACGNSTEVYVTSTIDIGAEFRAYVYKGKVVDVHRYMT